MGSSSESSNRTYRNLFHNITPLPKPLKNSDGSHHIVVIGGGVSGLTTAWLLLDRGYDVTILSSDWVNQGDKRLTSQIAGALWEFPPSVCGSHRNQVSLAYSKSWSMTSYQVWATIAADPVRAATAGVKMRRSVFFFPFKVEDNPAQLQKMKEIMASGVQGFRHDAALISLLGISPEYPVVDAYALDVPVIDTDIATEWLTKLVSDKGAYFRTEKITDDLVHIEGDILKTYHADAIVNCSGLSSKILANDQTVYPLRGGLIRLNNDGKSFPKIETAMVISAHVATDREDGIVFIVPRNDDTLLLGGFAEKGKWDLNLTLDSPIMQRMRARCEAFLPALKNAELQQGDSMMQGLRPGRAENVRVERETRWNSRIVHNYGHGGAGWSLGFGCAERVVHLVEEVFAGKEAVPMKEALGQLKASF